MTTARARGTTAKRLRRRELDPRDRYRSVLDEVLVASARAGDEAAFEALIERYGSMMRAVCRRHLRNEHDVEDAFQDTVLRAMSALPTLRDPRCVGGWLRTIASRCALDLCRGVTYASDDLTEMVDEAPTPEEHVVADFEAAQLHRHLDELTERDRGALWMRDAEEAPVSDIASFLGVTEGSARVALTRARHKLRAAYGQLVLAPLFAFRGWSRRFRNPVATEGAWGAALAQASLAVALIVVPTAGLDGDGATADATAPSVHLLASHDFASAAPTVDTVLDGSATRLRADAAEVATAAAAPADVGDGTLDAPWADTDVGPVEIDDRPPAGADTKRVDVADDDAPVSLGVDLVVETDGAPALPTTDLTGDVR